uniref:SFRICE_011499 n=1 Tax=Spodoptera frugiperda TaxID=7108 RepID=A0A2H1VV19_SPOFR
MRLLVSFITTIVILITICDVESFDHMQRLYQLMHEKNITAPKIRDYGNITKHCTNTTKKCLWKCCNFGESVRRSKCIPSKLDNILNDVVIYDSDLQQTDKDLLDTFHLVPNHFSHKQFRMYKFRLNILFETYLSEDGIVIIEMYNEFYRFYKIDVNSFCIDINEMIQKVLIYGVIYNENDDIPELNTASHYYRIIALILCTILLIFVIAIYCAHPHLRDLHGMLVTTLLCCYLGKTTIEIIHHINIIQREFYSILESLHIFFNLTTFSFTNVMFHNVWKSIRSERNAVNMRQNKLKQYFKYIAYGFGLPLVLTITISIINFIDMTSIPWFITPKFYRRQTCIDSRNI